MCALFFALGTASARYAIAMSVSVSTRHAAAVGATWGAIQAGQNTMILLVPLLGALVYERWGSAALFGVANGVGLVSLGVLLVVMWMVMPAAWAGWPSGLEAPGACRRVRCFRASSG